MGVEQVGVLHPGQMGVTVARAAAAGGAEVHWLAAGRSAASRERARGAGLVDAGTLEQLVGRCAILVSVCPPHAAVALAREVAAAGFAGTYVDANAISPDSARAVAATVGEAGAAFVDGGIIGPPATRSGTTRLYLSGERAREVAGVFEGSLLEPRVLEGGAGAASALKMCYASWTKGTMALLIAIRALAEREGVDQPLVAEWDLSQPGVSERSADAGTAVAGKAWRFVGELREIAASFSGADLPDGFGEAAAAIYERLAPLRELDRATLDDAVRLLLDPPGTG